MANHDSGYHLLFSHPELVEDLLRNFVPEDWVDQLDFTNMERVNAKFHTENLAQRDGDVIYRIHYKEGDGEIYLYLLLEFQSSPDKWMALRTLVYVGLLYQQLINEGRLDNNKSLPPVFPLVLYNGDKPWHCAQDLQSLIALPPNSPLRKWQPQISYYLLDESQYPDGKTGSITGAMFKIENSQNINELLGGLQLLEEQIPLTKDSLQRAMLTWIYRVVSPHKRLQLNKRELQNLTEAREMLSTRIQQWEKEMEKEFMEKCLEKGREEGREEGREVGREEGKLIEKTENLKKMLTLKFGPLPKTVEQRIDNADADTLDKWIENLLTANTLEDVFK